MNSALLELEAPALPISVMVAGRSYLAVNQGIIGGVITKINLDTINFNTGGGFLSADRFTVQTAGYYWFIGSVLFSAAAGQYTNVYVYINGGVTIATSGRNRNMAADSSMEAVGLRFLNVGDFLEVFARGSANWTAIGSQSETFLSILGPM